MTTTWNPSDKTVQITLSDSNHLMTATTTGANCGVRGTSSHSAGKWYLEYSNWVDGQFNNKVGFATAGHDLTQYNNTDAFGVDLTSGGFPDGATGPHVPFGALGSSVLQLAIDLDAQLYWCRVSGGPWIGAGSTPDPVAGVQGAPFSSWITPGDAAFPWAQMFSNSGHISQIQINCGDRSFTNDPPAGFTPWDQIPPVTRSFGVLIS